MNRSQKIAMMLGSLLLLLSLLSSGGCKEDPAFLLASQRTHIDTTVANLVTLLGPEMDSLCKMQFDSMVEVYKDSIMEIRLEEIQKIIGDE
ncbi:MAG: hypothetical protein AAGG75_08305 [Bacteroidota bacterium]